MADWVFRTPDYDTMIKEIDTLRTRVEAAERERDLTSSQLMMVASEICGDRKLDPQDHRDPRWTPILKEAANLRAEVKRLKVILQTGRETLARAEARLLQSDENWISLRKENTTLRAEVEKLREALKRIKDWLAPLAVSGGGSSLDKSYDTALAALADDGSGYNYNNSSDDFRDLLVRYGERSETHFNPIQVGRFSLSIQASKYHYSKPRETGLSPKDYERFEVALFYNGKWVKFPKWKLYYRGPWMKFHEGFDSGVFAYMPANIVQKLYERIKLLDKFSPPKLFIPKREADEENHYWRYVMDAEEVKHV